MYIEKAPNDMTGIDLNILPFNVVVKTPFFLRILSLHLEKN